MTADEALIKADQLYSQGNFPEASKMYLDFIANYGQAEAAKAAIAKLRFPLAMCFIQMQKFPEAEAAIADCLGSTPPPDARQRQELMFWKGVCQMQAQDYDGARATLEQFIALFPPGGERVPATIQAFPAVQKIPEAQMLIGTTLLLQGKFVEAADFYAKIKSALNAINRGRATVLELYALVQAGENARALELVQAEFPRMADLIQIVTFQTLTLELGSRFLEAGDFRKAIICLQRIWDRERLLKHQQKRLVTLESQLESAKANPKSDPYTKFLLGQMVAKVRREVENFSKVPNFDSALRLRLATAYQAMKRYREAALIMEAMLRDMPPDKIVEGASVNLVQSWNAIERWPKVVESANAFVETFPQSASVPLVLYLQGIAEQKALRHAEAVTVFNQIIKKHPQSDFAARAMFMRGFTQLLAEQNPDAIASFEEFLRTHPQHELAQAAAYWRGMGYSLDKQFARAREVMDDYLAAHKEGVYAGNAIFRKAYCAQQLEDYETSISELHAYLGKYPGHEQNSEARVLLGDALMNEGLMEEGIASFKGIPVTDTKFHEEGVFKIGKALKLMEEYDRLRNHMEEFRTGSPRSPRVAEAIYHIGWVDRQEGDLAKARQTYWDAINELGDDATIRSVEDLFPALGKLYKGAEEQAQYGAQLRDLREEADGAGKKTLAMRALWAQANAAKKSNPDRAREALVEASSRVNVQDTNPLVLADIAEALIGSGQADAGERMFRDLIKWNPRAPQRDRAFAALGLAELSRGNEKAALGWFERFEKETLGSTMQGKILLAKAGLLETRGQLTDARATLETLLASTYSTGPEKAEALFRIGDIYMKEGKPQLAVPYFQRIYVMHGRWRDWVARAYFRSGEAFEKLNDSLSARRTYQELTGRDELSEFQEFTKARDRLNALGGPLPPENPEPTAAQG
jgi:tetratricopeptide (TPR) repeat protein